jgi:hypothetical protein
MVVMDALDLHVLKIWPIRRLKTEPVGQIVEFDSQGIFEIVFEFDAADVD